MTINKYGCKTRLRDPPPNNKIARTQELVKVESPFIHAFRKRSTRHRMNRVRMFSKK